MSCSYLVLFFDSYIPATHLVSAVHEALRRAALGGGSQLLSLDPTQKIIMKGGNPQLTNQPSGIKTTVFRNSQRVVVVVEQLRIPLPVQGVRKRVRNRFHGTHAARTLRRLRIWSNTKRSVVVVVGG